MGLDIVLSVRRESDVRCYAQLPEILKINKNIVLTLVDQVFYW